MRRVVRATRRKPQGAAASLTPLDHAAAVTDANGMTIDQEPAELRCPHLPTNIISNILSYLPTNQVLALRCVSHGWNAAGQLPSSFRSVNNEQTVVTLRKPAKVHLSGIKILAVQAPPDKRFKAYSRHSKSPEEKPMSQQSYNDILDCIASSQHDSLVTLLLRPSTDNIMDRARSACSLATLCGHAFRQQLKHLECLIIQAEGWQLIKDATPFASLTSCEMTLYDPTGLGVPDQVVLPVLTRLMPGLRKVEVALIFAKVASLQPLFELPFLEKLKLTSLNQEMFRHEDVSATTPLQLLGTAASPTLQSLSISGSRKLHQLLVESTECGLSTVAPNLTSLVLHDVEYRTNLTYHLARLQHLKSLELTALHKLQYAAKRYRDNLLEALQQLPKLRTLRLNVAKSDQDYGNDPYAATSEYQRWSAEQLRTLLRLPLRELLVESLSDKAGQALDAFIGSQPPTVMVLQLGITRIDFEYLAAACHHLERLSLPASKYGDNLFVTFVNMPRELQALLDNPLRPISIYTGHNKEVLQEFLTTTFSNVGFWRAARDG